MSLVLVELMKFLNFHLTGDERDIFCAEMKYLKENIVLCLKSHINGENLENYLKNTNTHVANMIAIVNSILSKGKLFVSFMFPYSFSLDFKFSQKEVRCMYFTCIKAHFCCIDLLYNYRQHYNSDSLSGIC